MVLALGMPEHIPNTQGHDIAGTAECKYRSALGVDESRLEFWLPHLSGLYNNEVPSTIEGSCSRVNFPAPQCGVGPGKRANRRGEVLVRQMSGYPSNRELAVRDELGGALDGVGPIKPCGF